jgi:hypothetical protein
MDNVKDFINNMSLDKARKIFNKNFVVFMILGIIVSYIFFSILSVLFKTPFIIVFGIFLGFVFDKLYSQKTLINKFSKFFKKKIESEK